MKYFNSHAHVERDVAYPVLFVPQAYFNSHAHVERDDGVTVYEGVTEISTHTLTWSVTVSVCILTWYSLHFNSHAHVERDVHIHIYIQTYTFQLTRSRGA